MLLALCFWLQACRVSGFKGFWALSCWMFLFRAFLGSRFGISGLRVSGFRNF